MQRHFISYIRCSTDKQWRSRLGIEAQRASIEKFTSLHGVLVEEFVEIESGRSATRPKLVSAARRAGEIGGELIVASLDRLGRRLSEISTLLESDVNLVVVDAPYANRLLLQMLAVLAEDEARRVSARTRAALAAASARGVKLGNPNGAAHLAGRGNAEAVLALKRQAAVDAKRAMFHIQEIREMGVTSLAGIARELNVRRIPSSRGGRWYATSVANALKRTSAPEMQPSGVAI